MKRSINALCVLILVVVAISTILPLYEFGYSFGQGVKAGMTACEENKVTILDTNTTIAVNFQPELTKILENPEELQVENSEETLSVVLEKGAIFVPDSSIPTYFIISELLLNVLIMIGFVILVIKFIKFIININRNKVFEKINVKLLKQIGVILIVMATIQFMGGIIADCFVSTLPYILSGYEYSAAWDMPWGNVIIGLIALLMAQIWAKGIQLKEEQELTI